jgi:hypothetical protein
MISIDTILTSLTMLTGTMLRIHIAPVGFNVDRIVLPAEKMKADRVWLILHNDPQNDQGKTFTESIKKKLEQNRIEFKFERADRTDLFDTLRVLRSIVLGEIRNAIYVNVSAGSKIQAIASMMTCMMFKDTAMIKPYYAVPEKYTMFPKRPETIGLREIVTLPEYKVEIPDENLIECLALINQRAGGKISKKELKDQAFEKELIHVDDKSEHFEQAGYMSLNKNIIEPLLKWKFISIEKLGSRHIISLT